MKKILALLLIACSLIYAEETPPPESETTSAWDCLKPVPRNSRRKNRPCTQANCCSKNSSLDFGGSYTYVHLTPSGASAFTGSLGGAQGSYENKPENRAYEGLKFAWRQGMTYQGSNKQFLLDFDAQGRFGYTLASGSRCSMVTLFFGLGYRYLGHKLIQPHQLVSHFNYNEIYVPVGILVKSILNARYSLGLNVILMPQVYPVVTVSPFKKANWVLNRTFRNFLVEIPFRFNKDGSQNFHVEIKPFFEYWQDGKLAAAPPANLFAAIPTNSYLFCGVEMNMGWAF